MKMLEFSLAGALLDSLYHRFGRVLLHLGLCRRIGPFDGFTRGHSKPHRFVYGEGTVVIRVISDTQAWRRELKTTGTNDQYVLRRTARAHWGGLLLSSGPSAPEN